jgi:hypothetical protein
MSSILQRRPELTVDLSGRTPLHHACEAHCEPAVILALLETSAGVVSARARDVEGKLPLYLLCNGYHHLPSPSRIRKNLERLHQERALALSAMVTSIKLLVGLSPRTACIKDYEGRTILDYIQCSQVKQETEACLQLWRVMKLELSVAMDLSSPTPTKAGMFVKFSSEPNDRDEISFLSWSCV